jgi:hypothetical protein
MTKFVSVLLGIVILAFTAIARAGVVVDEQQTIDQPNGQKVNRSRTVMIEGNRQKSIIENGKRTVITDLDQGTMTMLDGARKTYVQFPFPPKGGGASAMQGALSPTVSFKKTGGHDRIIGYSCDEYSGAGMIGGNPVSMSGCFSDSAPGATDYSNFQREMADKVKGTPMENKGQIPPGVPLRLKFTTTILNVPTAGMTAEQAKSVNQMLAHRQFVTNTTVSKISTESLPAESFQVPPDYQKQQLPSMPMPAPSQQKAPE